MDYFFLFSVLALGVITSYEDVRRNKIRNKYVFGAILISLILNLGWFLGLFGDYRFDETYYLYVLLNVGLALASGFLLWMIGLWTPGDAKLFTAYAALIPLTVYEYNSFPYFYSSAILINTFLASFVLFAFTSALKPSKAAIKDVMRVLSLKGLISTFLFVFGFLWILEVILSSLFGRVDVIIYLAALLLIYYPLQKLNKQANYLLFFSLPLLRLIFDQGIYKPNFLAEFTAFYLVFLFIRSVVVFIRSAEKDVEIDVRDIKPGMILSEEITSDGAIISRHGSPVTAAGIEKLQELKEKKILEEKTLRVKKTVPFAPLLFAGVLLVYLFKGDMLLALRVMLLS